MWKTGHSLIKAKMRETGALLAGEMSGHLFFKERWYGFDDGLYAARLLEILSAASDPSAMLEGLPQSCATPEIKLETAEGEQFALVEAARARRISRRAVDQRSGRRAGGLRRRLRPGAAVQHHADGRAAFRRGHDGRPGAHRGGLPQRLASRRASCPFTVLRSTTRWIGLNLRGKRRKPRDCWTAPNGALRPCGALRGTGRRRAQADRGGGPEPGLVHAASVARAGGGGLALLRARGVPRAVQALFAGEAVNWTEDKPAGTRARGHARAARRPGCRLRLRVRAHAGLRARAGPGGGHRRRAAYRHRRQRLGPRLAVQAFGGPTQRRQIRFVSNIDGHAFNDAVTGLDPRRCLVVVSSKSFTTAETRTMPAPPSPGCAAA